jgi:phosphoserine phosphatase
MEGLSVYVGDSPSDLAPLTAADIGIVVGASSLLRSVAAAAGIEMHPLVAGELSFRPAACYKGADLQKLWSTR